MKYTNTLVLFLSFLLSFFLLTTPVVAAQGLTTQPTTLPKIENQSFAFTTTKLMTSFEGNGRIKSSTFIKKTPTIQKLAKKFFRSDEAVSISVTNTQDEKIKVDIVDAEGKKANVDMEQTKTDDQVTVDITPQTQFRPGKYKLMVTDSDGKKSEQDFFWGVLAINTNRSIYQPGQTAKIDMAVLNDKGDMVCDAKVVLEITHPNSKTTLSTENGKIVMNKQCTSHNFSLEPDYETSYVTTDEGTYDMTLTAETNNGKYTITDSFSVKKELPFDVERTSATRIYPPNNYPVKLNITANQDFDGIVTETVPESFVITPSEEDNSYDNAKTLYLEKKDDPANAVLGAMTGPSASDSALALPFSGSFAITQKFGAIETENILSKFYQHYGLSGHDGVDFGLPENTPLFAADEGNVVFAGPGDYGITVIIQHSWGKSYYGHLSKVTVDKDTIVTKGQQIGFSGNTGESTGPHLHFSIKPNTPDMTNGYLGKVDPLPYFNLPRASLLATNSQEIGVLGVSTTASNSAEFTVSENQLRTEALTNPSTPQHNKVKVIQWHLKLKKDERTTLSYQFKAPNISPQFYLLGPLSFYPSDPQTAEPLFQEARQWQIAADAVDTAWYSDGTPYGGYAWQYRKQITLTSSSTLIPSTQSNFPMLVNLTADNDLKINAQSSGNDILFTDSNGTKLSHEIEKYTTGTGELIAWVNVTSLATNGVIYMYYGNAAAANQQAATSVWDSNYKEVQHLEETSACSVTFTDSTSNAFNGSCVASGPTADSAGQIGAARAFNGSTQYISITNNSAFNPGSAAFTVEAWIKTTSTTTYQDIMSHFDGLGGWAFHMNSGLTNCPVSGFICLYDSNDSDGVSSGLSNNTWGHVVVVRSGTTATFYVNGTSVGTSTVQTTIPSTTNTERIGMEGDDSGPFSGSMDEVRYSNTNRTANWIKAEYSNQSSPSTFYTLGSVETKNFAASPEKMMRHGQFFNSSGVTQPFIF